MNNNPGKFDNYAATYDQLHAQSVSSSGEMSGYFFSYKVKRLQRLGLRMSHKVLDYGCGTGKMIDCLTKTGCEVHGYDPSEASLEVCRKRVPSAALHIHQLDIPRQAFDFVVVSGVLHHVPPHDRPRIIQEAVDALRQGGRLVVFEHNPFNPLTLQAVQDCPFDDDAILLHPREIIQLFRDAGLKNISLDYIVFFPRMLSVFRQFEPMLRWCPLGAQTMTVGARGSF